MKKYDVIVIGESAAGVVAAMTARKYYPEKSILMIRDVKDVPIPCGIPYIYGTAHDAMKNLIPVANIEKGNNLEAVIGKVEDVDRVNKTLELCGEVYQYDRLVLATGSKPIIPPIKGADLKNIFCVEKNPEYLQKIYDQLKDTKNVVVMGGGFIGCEMAEEIKKHDKSINVTVVEMQENLLKIVYDKEFCELAETALANQDINILTKEKVVEFVGETFVKGVKLESGKVLDADMVILGIGARANTDLAEKIGLELGEGRGIKVNRYMVTSDEAIFACGDCADKDSFFDHKPSMLKLASIATMEARIVGTNLFKYRRINRGVVGCFSTVLGGNVFAAAGLNEDEAKRKGFEVVTAVAESINRHPGLMPGGQNLRVKLLFEKGTRGIVGGEIYGAYSGGELINAISAFISKEMTADEIVLFQAGTHPALTASPIAYQLVNAAENALVKLTNEYSIDN
jgi:NADPH-dependent 2,4-dienoyl-CoA reductase/sulfur reductase-like enzyme